MSKSRKPQNARKSKPSSGGSTKKGTKSGSQEQSAKPSEKARLIRLIALFVLVGSLGYLWLDRNRQSAPSSTNHRLDASSGDTSNSSERIRSLEGMSVEQLEQFLKIPALESDLEKSTKVDVEMWTQQLDRDLEQVQQRQPNDAKIEHLVGLANLRLKRTSQAEPNLRRAVELEPSNPQMRFDLADLLLQLGRDGDALEALNGIGRTVSNAQYLVLTAECQTRQGKLAEAVMTLTLAVELAPNNADIWVRLGKLQLQQKDFENARRNATRATEIDGAFADGWLLLSQVNKLLKDSTSNQRDEAVE
ncbi:MAG: tetratricopeptide repeat protein [Pirellulales bacterium]